MSAAAPKVGDTVYVDNASYPGAWTVTKVNQVTVKLSQEGRPRGLNAHKSLLMDAPKTTEQIIAQLRRTPFSLGAVVEWADAPPKAGGKLFVVWKDDIEKVNVSLLGGVEKYGVYWRVSADRLTAVPLDVLAKRLAAGDR